MQTDLLKLYINSRIFEFLAPCRKIKLLRMRKTVIVFLKREDVFAKLFFCLFIIRPFFGPRQREIHFSKYSCKKAVFRKMNPKTFENSLIPLYNSNFGCSHALLRQFLDSNAYQSLSYVRISISVFGFFWTKFKATLVFCNNIPVG